MWRLHTNLLYKFEGNIATVNSITECLTDPRPTEFIRFQLSIALSETFAFLCIEWFRFYSSRRDNDNQLRRQEANETFRRHFG